MEREYELFELLADGRQCGAARPMVCETFV